MKKLNFFILLCLFIACNPANQTSEIPDSNVETPESLKAKWESDEYGMKQYVMALLKAGPNRDQDSTTAAELQKAHLDNIGRMAEAGKLVLAGPFMDDWEVKGIYIFNVQSIEEARALTESDPSIQAGRLIMELHPWYGTAALMEINELHSKMEVQDP